MNNDSNIKVKIAEPFEKEDISELKKVSDLTMEKRFVSFFFEFCGYFEIFLNVSNIVFIGKNITRAKHY